MLSWLFESGFMPHGHCYFWRPDILWMHVVSDAVIALAYFSIPVTLLYFLRRRPDIPFPGLVALFALFIVLCGAGHLFEIWTVWQPVYALQGLEKSATAVVSILTAAALVPVIPQVLAMRTPAQLQVEVNTAVERLRETQDQLVQNEKMASLGALVAGVSHEINTPVGIGVTAASTLEQLTARFADRRAAQAPTPAEVAEFAAVAREASQMILTNLQRASELIHSFKQVAVDQASSERRRFDLREYLDEVLLSLGPKLKRTPHAVALDCPPNLVLDSYPGALAQIVTNLLTNSLLHAYPDARAGRITISAARQGEDVRLVYADDGAGIAPEHLGRVFDPFFTTQRGRGGSGLGMHIVYNLVTRMLGGAIDLASRPGEGTRVTVTFPASARPAAA
jgi:signal transduction histidine kinase